MFSSRSNSILKCKKAFHFFYLLLFLILSNNFALAQFTKIAGAKGLNNSAGGNMNGHAWGDLNNDGYFDVIFHAGTSGTNAEGKLFINDGPPNFTFSDSTSTLINGFNDANNYGRQMLIVDFNNDGYNDILRGFGSSRNTEIFYNDGPPNYTFGDSNQDPDIEIGSPGDGGEWNTEGIVAIDWNQDGWLDIIIDNDGGGNDVYENDQAGGFTLISGGTSTGQTGFPVSHSGDGDFITVADIDDDGYVDLYGRKTAVSNFWWFNSATSQFETQVNPNIVSSESDKGGTMFCDFDGDGDLDLFWTSNGNNEIWRNDGSNIWTATGIPAAPIRIQSDIDGCDCGDVDNDGDIDIFMGASSGNSYLLVNNTSPGGSLSFSTTNIATNANTESTTFTDFDNDGDLDLYAVVDGSENQLWENSTNDNNYLYVNALTDNGNSTARYAIGSNVFLTDCVGDTLVMKQVNGGKGHGSQHQTKVHFGVDPNERYIVEIHYVYNNGERTIVKRSVIPSEETNQEITILNTDYDNVQFCYDFDIDGITDFEDLDDDNDGILDADEFEICGVADWTTGSYTSGNTNYEPSIINSGTVGSASVTFTAFEVGTPTIEFLRIDDAIGGNGSEGVFFRGKNTSAADDAINWTIDFDTSVYNVDLYFGSLDNGDEIRVQAFHKGDFIFLDSTNFEIYDTDNLFYTNSNIVYAPSNGAGSEDVFDEAFRFKLAGAVDSLVFTAFKNTGGSNNVTLWISDFQYCLPADTDNDGIPDHLDLDSDNDGISDLVEAGGVDTDGDGQIDSTVDTDLNGIIDLYDSGNGGDNILNPDTDSDGIPDYKDLDADNDGIADVVEAGGTDTNGDGIADGFLDTDRDGFNDLIDGDVGNDGTVENTANVLIITGSDTDADGIPNSYPLADKDNDGHLNHTDLDADNDGIQDIVEAGGADTNGDGYVDNYNPATNAFTGTGDSEGDGFSNYYDSDTNNDGTTGDAGTNPLVITSTDGDSNGKPDSGYTSGDLDGDALLNHLDLDADDDGILDTVEASITDDDYNGIADDATSNDADGNGWSNTYDGENGGTQAVVTTDASPDGLPDSYDTQNKDMDANPNFLDIDADNDGIVDNTEAQATFSYISPDNLDSDSDGIDDAYDNINGFGGAGITPVNIDMTDEPDYLDTDTDNDGEADSIEGHDTNGDGVVDGSDTPLASTGLAGGTTDIDKDGLLDGFDNNTSNPEATNTSLTPLSHPDVDNVGVDQDWRQGVCELCRSEYAIQDGSGTQTTSYLYNATTNLLETTTNTYGVIRTNRYCLIDGWRYYYNPASPTEALIAIRGDVADLNKIEYIDFTVGQTPSDREAGITDDSYARVMNRDWAASLSSDLSNNVDVKFYYPGLDFGTNGYQAADTNSDTYNLTGSIDAEWFNLSSWSSFDPTTILADASNLMGVSPGYSPIAPVVDANTTTGLSEIDGTAATVGNAKNFVQFNGLSNIDGGSAIFTTNLSSLPVDLSRFDAEVMGCNIQLTWTAETEESFSHYELEWSGDGQLFQHFKTVNAEGGSMRQTYQITDSDAAAENYYRLKMIDLDGSFEYSKVLHITTNCGQEHDIAVYPNPIIKGSNSMYVKFFAERENAQLIVTNVTGQVIKRLSLQTGKEWNTIQLDISDLPSGSYFIKVLGARDAKTFVIQE